MAQVKLRCDVYGEGTVFPVEIARGEEVSALQEAIVNGKKTVNDRFDVDPAKLTLYLARKEGGEWLSGGQNVKNLLCGAVNTEYPEMFSWWKLDKEELLGPEFTPADDSRTGETPRSSANCGGTGAVNAASGPRVDSQLVERVSLEPDSTSPFTTCRRAGSFHRTRAISEDHTSRGNSRQLDTQNEDPIS